MPEASSLPEPESPRRGPQYRPPRLLARAGILHAPRIRGPVPSAVRRAQSLRQRLWRSLRGSRRQGRLGRGQVLAGTDYPVLSDERAHLPDGSRSLGQPARGTAQGWILSGDGLEHPGILGPILPGSVRGLRHRAAAAFHGAPARREADLAQPTLQRFTRRRPLLASGLRCLGPGRRQTARPAARRREDREVLPRQESFASLHILTRRASEGSEALPWLARRVRMSFFGARVIRPGY